MIDNGISVRASAPFRADHVGSLLRPQALKAARTLREGGDYSADELRATEDLAIETIIRKQAALGLRGITDGEFRRAYWHFDFLEGLEGVDSVETTAGIQFHGGVSRRKILSVVRKLDYKQH